jgi:hypothetical protein
MGTVRVHGHAPQLELTFQDTTKVQYEARFRRARPDHDRHRVRAVRVPGRAAVPDQLLSNKTSPPVFTRRVFLYTVLDFVFHDEKRGEG